MADATGHVAPFARVGASSTFSLRVVRVALVFRLEAEVLVRGTEEHLAVTPSVHLSDLSKPAVSVGGSL